MKTEFPALTDSPVRAADGAVQALWVWRLSGLVGRWLPEALLDALGQERPIVEPFADTGEKSALARGWRTDVPRESDEKQLGAFLAAAGGLVHSVDRWVDSLQIAMADIGAQRGGRHLILFTRDPVVRLAERLAAQPAHLPIEALLKQDREAMARLGRVRLALGRAPSLPIHVVAHDDLAATDSRGDIAWRELRQLLDGRRELGSAVEAAWRERLASDMKSVDGALDAHSRVLLQREALWAGGAELTPAALRAVERPSQAQRGAIRWARLDRLPSILREGESVRLSGVVVPAGPLQADRRLFVRQGPRRQRLGWDLASPAVAAKLPDEPSAGRARFKPVALQVSRRQPATLLYRADERAAPTPVTEIAFEPVDREAIEGILLARWSIGYQPIPKVACTSIKEALFRAATGLPFSPAHGEGADHVHRYFDLRMRDVSAASFRFLVVRDPIKRFLSAFGNRVLHHKELSRSYVERQTLTPALDLESFPFDPDLARFVDQFELYRRIPTINHHFRPISEFSAPLSAFDKVYPFEALDELVAELQRRTGVPMSLPHSQRGGPKLQASDLSPRVFGKLVEIFADDYEMLDGLYSPAALRP
jgi:hypothetical protein